MTNLQLGLNDLGLGRLCLANSEDEIEYQPFEVSRTSLGIIARPGLEVGSRVALQSIVGPVEFEVIDQSRKGVVADQERYFLNLADRREVDVEAVFSQSGCYERIANLKSQAEVAGLMQFRNARFTKGPPLSVVARTFGTPYKYYFVTKNLSKSGVLLEANREVVAPFQINTLLEVTLDLDCTWLKAPLTCLAKVVRRSADPDTTSKGPCFGIHFIEFGEETQRQWRALIDVADQVQLEVARLAS